MKITFYGTRGSIPVPDGDFIQFGGNTSCVMLTLDDGHVIIFDAGTGIRKLGNDLFKQSYEQSAEIAIVLSHTHWDHIQGFPFFAPDHDDIFLQNLEILCQKRFPSAFFAREGAEIKL